jgi:hypothetical protein
MESSARHLRTASRSPFRSRASWHGASAMRTTIYAGLLKQYGDAVDGRKAQGKAKTANAHTSIGPKSLRPNLPTVTRIDVSDDAVR